MDYNVDDQNDLVQNDDETPAWNLNVTSSSEECASGEGVINYFFPVEIVIAGSLAPQERTIIQAQIYQDLHDAIIDKLA